LQESIQSFDSIINCVVGPDFRFYSATSLFAANRENGVAELGGKQFLYNHHLSCAVSTHWYTSHQIQAFI